MLKGRADSAVMQTNGFSVPGDFKPDIWSAREIQLSWKFHFTEKLTEPTALPVFNYVNEYFNKQFGIQVKWLYHLIWP